MAEQVPAVLGTAEELSGFTAGSLLWAPLAAYGPGPRCDAACRELVERFYKPLPEAVA